MNLIQTILCSLGLMQRPEKKRGIQIASLLGGLGVGMGVGALLMYWLDPVWGRRRRSMARNQVLHAGHLTGDAFSTAGRDLANRARGTLAQSRSLFDGHPASDEILVARIRSRMGRIVSHPRRIEVTALNGHVTLNGLILASEQKALLKAVGAMKGVSGLTNQLQAEVVIENGLDGQRRAGWKPAGRLAAGLAGTALVAYGARRRGAMGMGLGMAGASLASRGLASMGLGRPAGLGGRRAGIRIDKSINIDAPVADVFNIWANYENFPLFMRNVREVTDLGGGLSHWRVSGLAGSTFEWDAEVTDWRQDDVIAWQSRPGSIVGSAGVVRFVPNPDGTTRVDVHLRYDPPAGLLGHLVASLFHADPKHEMDADLNRMKTTIETGNAPHDAADPALHDMREAGV